MSVAVQAGGPRLAGAWDVLLDTLLHERANLAGRVRAAIQAKLPAYRLMPADILDGEVAIQVEWVLSSIRDGGEEISGLAAVGEVRAQQGVPVAEMLRAWRIGITVLIGYAREVGRDLGIEDALMLEFVQSALAWSDLAMVTTAAAHDKAELALALSEEVHRGTFVRGVLFGSLPSSELRVQAEAYGLDPSREYVAVRGRLDRVPRSLGRGLTAVVDGCVAGFLSDPPPRDIDAVVGIGPPRLLERLAESYRSAARALATMEAFGLRGGWDIPALGLRAAVAMDADVGQVLRERYLEPLNAAGSAAELSATLRAYLACGMHVERTATRLFVHQNTVRYRLARFEQLTGASLRETQVLVELWWALELSAMRL